MPFCCFEAFLGNFIENFLFRHKSDYLIETRTEILCKFVFLTMFEKWQILRKIWICISNFFWSNQLKTININKNGFSPQSKPHTAKLYFVWFWSILLEINRELFFLDIKMTISETSTEKLRKFVFLTMFEKGQILRKIWIF